MPVSCFNVDIVDTIAEIGDQFEIGAALAKTAPEIWSVTVGTRNIGLAHRAQSSASRSIGKSSALRRTLNNSASGPQRLPAACV